MKDLGTCPDCGHSLNETPYDWTCPWHAEYARVQSDKVVQLPVAPRLRVIENLPTKETADDY